MSINLAPLVGHSAVRFAAGLADDRPPADDELRHMQRLVAESVEQGAFGMSTGLTLPPSSYAATDEIVALASVDDGVPRAPSTPLTPGSGAATTSVPSRKPPRSADARASRSSSATSRSSTRACIGHPEQLIDVIDRALAGGQDLTADVYPYTAAGTGLNQFLPEWAQEGGPDAMLARLRDPATRAQVREDSAEGWFKGLPWDWDSLVLRDITTRGEPPSAREVARGSRGRTGRGPARHVPEPDRGGGQRGRDRGPQPDRPRHARVSRAPGRHGRLRRERDLARRPARPAAQAPPALLRHVSAHPRPVRPGPADGHARGGRPQDDRDAGDAGWGCATAASCGKVPSRTSSCSTRRRSRIGPRSRSRTSSRSG